MADGGEPDMCGFAGQYRFDDQAPSAALVESMSQKLAPRGPDGAGVFVHGPVALAHRRLKIIDLSEHAAQPMVDAQMGLTVVFNGCIYNYKELRKTLEAVGYRFFSHGDTEVISKAYHHWGAACVEHLQGMFAFAVYERDTGRLVLARDRFGIKPLYVAEVDGALVFASTLPALLDVPRIDKTIDPVALQHYLTFHSVVPAPRTILAGIRKIPPATVWTLERDGTKREQTFWTLSFEPDTGPSFEDWQDEVLAVLEKAVRRRLVADVPVGVLLSGGLDSSLLVGLLRKAGQTGLATYSIGFEAVRNESGDEFKYSDIIANHFETDHHKIFIDPAETLENLDACIHAMSEPMVSHDNIGFYLLSREVSKTIKVVQSGQGADEVFAGYHWYPPLSHGDAGVGDYARVFFDRDYAEFKEVVHSQWVPGRDEAYDFVQTWFARAPCSRAVDRALHLDTNVMLVDDPVKRVDNMTMAWGLEARVPFLDHEVVELAARIPAEHKLAFGGKGVVKEAARRVIPAAVIDRPKGYFPVPALTYLEGTFLAKVVDALHSPLARERGLFQQGYLERLIEAPAEHITPLRGSKLWQLALLELWMQSHGI